MKPVRFIVPFPPGQAADVLARVLADRLSQEWKQQVVVENRSGASGMIAMEAGAKTAPDGYALTIGTAGTLAINPSLFAKLPYDPLRDFAPVTRISSGSFALLVHPSVPVRTLRELVAFAKARPGALNYGSAGPGSPQHLSVEMLKSATGMNLTHIPYRGSGPAMQDLLGGQIPVHIDSVTASVGQIRAGKVRALAVTTARRSHVLPEVPTVDESGYPGFDAAGWIGLVAPSATPPDLVSRISRDVRSALEHESVSKRFLEQGATPLPLSPEAFFAFILVEIKKWGDVVRQTGTRLQ